MSLNQSTILKRSTDLLLTAGALFILWPFLFGLWALVRWRLGKPAFFRQLRPGWHEKPFLLYKFRTMTDVRDEQGELLPDGERLTPLGRWLRSASLDELPELFNVLKGDMSLVGPRPLFMKYLPYYTKEERVRHSIRPGITGWAQIQGRNYLPWNQRLAMDVWYVRNRSFLLDLTILLRTIGQVLRREGVAADADTVETDLDRERQNCR